MKRCYLQHIDIYFEKIFLESNGRSAKTMIYPSSTTEMAVSIGCEYDIHKIKREHFCRELKNIGIGEKLAMRHYDDMLSRIESALEESCETLMQQGFIQAKDMKKRILEVRKPAWM